MVSPGNGFDCEAPEPTYIYHSADGKPWLSVHRFDKPDAYKEFRQSHWSGAAWVWGGAKGPKFPYQLPEILLAETVIIVEGEKDVETLRRRGFTATANAG